MAFIHERKAWPNLTWKEDAVSAAAAYVHHRQGVLYGKMEGYQNVHCQIKADLDARTDDVVKSAAIEGETLDPKAVRDSLARQIGFSVSEEEPPTPEVDGFVRVIVNATQSCYQDSLTEERLLGWHASLFQSAVDGGERITSGAWRTPASGAMQVVSGAVGKEVVHFEAPEAARLPREMEHFLQWLDNSSGLDPLLRAGVAHLYFVTIHPFEDGNGRIARVISDMVLSQGVCWRRRYFSLSAQIYAERKDYYEKLEATQRGGLDITPWLKWFVECCGRAVERAHNDLETTVVRQKVWRVVVDTPTINARQRRALTHLLNGEAEKVSTTKYARLTECSEDTALRDMTALVDAGFLQKDGKGGRSTRYGLPELAILDHIAKGGLRSFKVRRG